MNEHETARLLRLVGDLSGCFEAEVQGAEPNAAWNILTQLVVAHLSNSPITSTELINASGLPYTTGFRKVRELEASGQIVRRPKIPGAKSGYLEPSRKLLAEFEGYVRNLKGVISTSMGFKHKNADHDDYYFGGATPISDLLPPTSLHADEELKHNGLRFLLHEDNYFKSMQNMWSDFRTSLAAKSDFDLYQLDELYSRLDSAVRQKDPPYDITVVDMPWLGEFAERESIMCLDDFIAESNLNAFDYHPAIWSTGEWRNRQYGIPIYCTVEMLAARKDIFAERGLDYPSTFASTLERAKELHDPLNDFYGIAWSAKRGDSITHTFMSLMGCMGRPVMNVPKGRRYYAWSDLDEVSIMPKFDCDEGYQVLEFLHDLIAYSPPNILDMGPNERIKCFMSGRAAMSYVWSMRAARFEYELKSKVKRRVAYLPMPKGPGGLHASPIGGFLLSIPQNLSPERARLAFDAIAWMAAPETMREQVKNGIPVAPRFSVAADPEAAASSPIVRFVDQLAQRRLLFNWQRPPVPHYSVMDNALGQRIHDALRGEISDRRALKSAEDMVHRHLEDRFRQIRAAE